MILYPANFPQPSTSLSGRAETPTIRTENDKGLAEQYGRFSTALETFQASWKLSQDELTVFEEWFSETLAGGNLVFGLLLPDDGAYSLTPVRFVGGKYSVTHDGGLFFTVTATIESLTFKNAPANRTPPVPQFVRLALDEAFSQNLTLSMRNALLTTRPALGNLTTLRIYPPTDSTQYIYFGIRNFGDGDVLITSEDVDPLFPYPVQDFPADLPAINRQFGFSAERQALRLEMDSGHPRQFAGFETTVKSYQVEWEFSLDQLQTFQDFFYISLKSGATPFTLTLPVDGLFTPIQVRFVGGQYSESYVIPDRFRVSATVEPIISQTVTPTPEKPYAVYYSPTVNVTANRKVYNSDAGKLFVVSPSAGQTISLHISNRMIEFGLLVKGLGNVLITRGPFILDIGAAPADQLGTVFNKPSFAIVSVIRNIGAITPDQLGTVFNKPTFEILTTVKPIGSIGEDICGTVFNKPTFEIKLVLKDIGAIPADQMGTVFNKPTFSID